MAAEGEIIEVDGKKYREVNGELVEVIEHQPKSISIMVAGEEITLTEGEQYKNYFGNYILRTINSGDPVTVTVLYVDGQFKNETKTYPAKSQAEAVSSEQKRILRNEEERLGIDVVRFSSLNEFFTLGYMAKNARITIEVPKFLAANFEFKYNRLTGDDAKNHLADKSYYIAPKEKNRWAVKGRLTFNIKTSAMSRMSFPSNIGIISRAGHIEINNNNYIYNMFKNGFKLGYNENNYSNIVSGLSGEYKEAFDEGFNA